MLNSFM